MSESLHRAPSSSAASVSHRDTPARRLANDAKFVFRLKRKLSQLFCDKAGNGVISLDPEFVHADRCVNDDNYKVDLWGLKTFLHSCGNATRSLSEKDLEVLFDIVRREGSGGVADAATGDVGDGSSSVASSKNDDDASAGYVDLAEVMLWLRKLFHCTSQQFHAILKRLRAKQLDERLCTFAKRHHKHAQRRREGRSSSSPVSPVTRSEVFSYLISAGGLTQSEAFLFLEYCSVPVPAVVEAQEQLPSLSPMLDVEFVIAALFEFPLPDDIAYPLLMAKFVEAVSDPYRVVSGTSAEAVPTLSRSGVSGIYEALLQCDLREPPTERRQASASESTTDASSADGDNESLQVADGEQSRPKPWFHVPNMHQLIDEAQFRKLNFLVCGGLPNKECDLLFSFLNDRSTGLLPVSVLMEQYAMRLEPVPLHELELWAMNVRMALLERMPNGLNGLHLRLARFGDRPIPVVELSAALRECGVSHAVAPDAVLDELWRQAATCASFVLLLRGDLPPSRTAIIRKLFAMLDSDADGLVSRDIVFTSFMPSDGTSNGGGFFGKAKDWKDDLAAYLQSLPQDENLSYAEFEYYWGNVAVSVADDNTFTMLLWKAYAMHRPPRQVSASTNSPARRPLTPNRVHGDSAAPSWGSSYCLPQDTSPQPPRVSRRLLR